MDPTVPADWFIGEDVYLPSPDGFRNMADPEEHGDPDDYSEFQVGGNVHTNSGIPNHAYYLLVNGGLNASCADPEHHNSAHCTGGIGDGSEVTGIGVADAERIFFLGFTALSSGATMANARAATEAEATTLFGAASLQLQSTTDAWVAVGVGPAGPGGGDNPPTISVTSPLNGATVSGTIDVTADAADDNGVTQVEFFVDDASIGVDFDAPYAVQWNTNDGDHTVSATATDTIWQTDSDSVGVNVDNSLLPAGSSCTEDGQCLSNKCKGKSGNKTCK